MPLIKSKGATKYFLAQRLGSAIILRGVALTQEFLVVIGAIVKAGIAPVHSWFPQVMEHLRWRLCLVLSTWQKVGPIAIILSCCTISFIPVFIVASLRMGAIGALKQGRLRSIIALSSITHIG